MDLLKKYHDYSQFELTQAFYEACAKDNLEQVKHLLENSKYKINPSLEEDLGDLTEVEKLIEIYSNIVLKG